MSLALLDSGIDLIEFEVVNQGIAGASTWTLEIDLGKDGFTVAHIQLWNKSTVSTTYARNQSAYIIATQDINDAYSQANSRYWIGFTSSGNTYSNVNYRYEGFSYATDGALSKPYFSRYGRYIRINSALIDGSILKIEFENTHGTITEYLQIDGRVRLERSELV